MEWESVPSDESVSVSLPPSTPTPLHLSLSLSRNPQRDLQELTCCMQKPSPTDGSWDTTISNPLHPLLSPSPALPSLPPQAPGEGVGQLRHLGEGGEVGKEVLRTSYWERQTSPSETHTPLSSQVREKKKKKQRSEGKRQHPGSQYETVKFISALERWKRSFAPFR